MLVQCSHCGAPLDVRDSSRHIKCSYCDHSNRVRTMHTIAAEAPPAWKPPPQWTPPPSKREPAPKPLQYHQPRPRRRGFFGSLGMFMALIGVLVPLAINFWPAIEAMGLLSRLSGIGRAVGITTWDGTGPFRCSANDSVVIENVTAVLPEGTAITVEDNCEVRIVGSSITARRGIRASGNGRVAVENSRIDTSSTAIWADGNKRIELLDSEVTAQEIGIHASGNVKVSLTGGRVSGNPVLSMKSRTKLDNQGTELVDFTPASAPKARPGRADKSDERRRARRARQQAE